jgi:hypothetical protein
VSSINQFLAQMTYSTNLIDQHTLGSVITFLVAEVVWKRLDITQETWATLQLRTAQIGAVWEVYY